MKAAWFRFSGTRKSSTNFAHDMLITGNEVCKKWTVAQEADLDCMDKVLWSAAGHKRSQDLQLELLWPLYPSKLI